MSTTQVQSVESTAEQPKMIVLLTIHGIGFQLSPEDGPEGYADPLHKQLALPENLGGDLSSDPNPSHRDPNTPREGAVYVQSHWPPTSDDAELGLARLDGKLRKGSERFAHVALVYSHLEDSKPKPLSFLEMLVQAAFQHRNYGKFRQLVRWGWRDIAAAFGKGGQRYVDVVSPQPPTAASTPSPSLTPRGGAGLRSTVLAIENDFAAYLLRNDLRERVRGFVREALIRLAERGDVDAVVINCHSQGTAVAFDVMAELPRPTIAKIAHLVTSGSHLRKLVRLFNWGSDIGNIPIDVPWTNFYDLRDPVADGLCPERWIPGKARECESDQRTLFNKMEVTTAGVKVLDRPVTDIVVDNMRYSRGSLRAHNYFDNAHDFVPKLVKLLRDVGARQPASAPVP